MKKLIWVVTITFFGILACKKKEETPSPTVKKYEYKRTPGEVTRIEGDVYVDTGGTVFTVKGKGFDSRKKKYYHLLLGDRCGNVERYHLNGYQTNLTYADTARLIQITDTVIKFLVDSKNVYNSRGNASGYCLLNDSIVVYVGVSSKDSTNENQILSKFDVLSTKKVENKLFFNILKDTLIWHTKQNYKSEEIALTIDDAVPGGVYGNQVSLYFNDILINTTNSMVFSGTTFPESDPLEGDSYFVFGAAFYKENATLGLKDGEYTISMKQTKTGVPIDPKRGRNKVYVKFVN